MTAALIILAALVLVGGVLYVHHMCTAPLPPEGGDSEATPPSGGRGASEGECCGMHITCERDSLLASVSSEVVYYDDEELDSYRGRPAHAYTDAETEQFRDVLLTLLPTDIAGWARSLQLRGIEMPESVRDELLMIVSEARASQGKK